MPVDRSRTWDGGYIRTNSKGRPTYYIFRRIGGRLYEISTRCTTSGAAEKQLKLFEGDPAGYRPGAAGEGAVLLTPDLIEQFLKWSKYAKRNSATWVRDQQTALRWWIDRLGRIDLRRLEAPEVVRYLDEAETGRKQKIATLKTFFSWLRRERQALTNDPTATLSVPQSRPEQWTVEKVIPAADYRKVRAKLDAPWRDAIDVLAGTGWHVSELLRFAATGRVDAHPMREGARVLACPQTKGGEPLRTEVSAAVADAGQRLLSHGAIDYFDFRDALIEASKAAKLKEPIKAGRFRHSVATWAINSGADPAAVAAFLGHKSPATTRKFYATHAVPAKVPTIA